jgi:hypothetical protein
MMYHYVVAYTICTVYEQEKSEVIGKALDVHSKRLFYSIGFA